MYIAAATSDIYERIMKKHEGWLQDELSEDASATTQSSTIASGLH